jgi:hypothetical protein
MNKRRALVLLLLFVVVIGSVAAAKSGAISFVNYASWKDYSGGESANYVPGLRGEFFLNNNLGISADALLLYTWENYLGLGKPLHLMMYMINGVFRFPFSIVEPYVALGPTYLGVIYDGDSSEGDTIGFNVRGGADFKILDWLSLGAEVNYFVDDLEDFFKDIGSYFTADKFKDQALIGISAKFTF